MVSNYFMRFRVCQLITSPFWATAPHLHLHLQLIPSYPLSPYPHPTQLNSSLPMPSHPMPSNVCGKMHECVQYNEIHLFNACLTVCPTVPSSPVLSHPVLFRSPPFQGPLQFSLGTARGAWQTCPDNLERAAAANLEFSQHSILSRNENCSAQC